MRNSASQKRNTLHSAFHISMTAIAVAAVFAAPVSAAGLLNPDDTTFEADTTLVVDQALTTSGLVGLGANDGKSHTVSTGNNAATITIGQAVPEKNPYMGIGVRTDETVLNLNGNWTVNLEQTDQTKAALFGVNVKNGTLNVDGTMKAKVKSGGLQGVGVSVDQGTANFKGELLELAVEAGDATVSGFNNPEFADLFYAYGVLDSGRFIGESSHLVGLGSNQASFYLRA